jgi:hypothetical protein
MIVRTLAEILGTERDVRTERWESRRLLLKADRMGFSMHDTRVRAGSETEIWYRHHREACYCVEGDGELEVLATGRVHPIRPAPTSGWSASLARPSPAARSTTRRAPTRSSTDAAAPAASHWRQHLTTAVGACESCCAARREAPCTH